MQFVSMRQLAGPPAANDCRGAEVAMMPTMMSRAQAVINM